MLLRANGRESRSAGRRRALCIAPLPPRRARLPSRALKILASLNPEQRRAVTTTEGPVLVLAGAGTGKTRVVTVRIAYLLHRGVEPEHILAMTFTNKAAREMRRRVAELVGKKKAERIFVGTFHSFCIDLLRRYGSEIGIGRFTISDDSDQAAMIRSAMREVTVSGVAMQPAQVLSQISLMKGRLLDPDSALEAAGDDRAELVAHVWKRYDEQLRRSRCLDFDDILLQALALLRKKGGPADELRDRYRYVMVDEYQDTNGPQYEIVRAIAGRHRNLCVVGDDDQSIYGWRGADIGKILGFEKDYARAAVVKLETNYRSTEQILDAANRVIRNNPNRHDKTLRSHAGRGRPVRAYLAPDENDEASSVVGEIRRNVDSGDAKFGDYAILFRTGQQARNFEAELRASRVPYVLVGGMSFFDRKEIRDIVAYLKLIVNPDDEVSLLRVVNCPPRGIGKASIDRILQHATDSGVSVSRAFSLAAEVPGVPAAAASACSDFLHVLERLRQRKAPLEEQVGAIIEGVNYRLEVEKSYPTAELQAQRWSAVEEVINFAENHRRRRGNAATLETFLHELALEADDDPTSEETRDRSSVTLMTLHAAKGLEYPYVYLVGMEEGLLPHSRAIAENSIEEERRLAYVGITRAREQLTFTRTVSRARHGRRAPSMASRFFYEFTGEKPPEDWVPAGEDRPVVGSPAAKKSKAKRKAPATRRRRAASRD
jgi:DNA helicase-2/ATP-dependent DNA helicase PcrA